MTEQLARVALTAPKLSVCLPMGRREIILEQCAKRDMAFVCKHWYGNRERDHGVEGPSYILNCVSTDLSIIKQLNTKEVR